MHKSFKDPLNTPGEFADWKEKLDALEEIPGEAFDMDRLQDMIASRMGPVNERIKSDRRKQKVRVLFWYPAVAASIILLLS